MIRTACSTLLPDDWRKGVDAPPLPNGNTAGDWISFGDAAVAQLEKANGRTVDAIGIVERCEQRDQEALRLSTKRWWQVWK